MPGSKFVSQFAHGVRLVGDLAIIADFAIPASIRQTYGDPGLADIQSNVNCCIILHGSSPMSEALTGLPANPRSDILRDGPPASVKDMGSQGFELRRSLGMRRRFD